MRKTIRTLLFSTLFPSSARPAHGIFVEARLRHLCAHGEVDARVVAPVPWFPSRHGRFGAWAAYAASPAHERRGGIEVWHPRYALPPKIGMSIAPLLLALGARATVARLLRTGEGFDLLDAHYYYPDGAAAALLSSWFGKPFVVTARGTDLNLLSNYAVPRGWIRWTAARAAHSILVSEALRARLVELGGDPRRMSVIRNGVDSELFACGDKQVARDKLALPSGRHWLVSVGNLIESKGHAIAIASLEHLPQSVNLIVIGEGPDSERLLALAASRGAADRVRLTGRLTQVDLVDWYNAADALVLCSSREGTPNVALEAMACGTPVVATAVGGLPEIITSPAAGRLVAERTPAALAGAVLQILAAPPARQTTQTHAARFSWSDTTHRQLDVFRAVLARDSDEPQALPARE